MIDVENFNFVQNANDLKKKLNKKATHYNIKKEGIEFIETWWIDKDVYKIKTEDTTIKCYKNGLLHREEDKPAIIRQYYSVEFYKNGLLHRDGNKPAVIYTSGDQIWFENGEQHNLKGAARINKGKEEYWIHNKNYTYEEWLKYTKKGKSK